MFASETYERITNRLRNRPHMPALLPEHAWHPALDEEIAALPAARWAGERTDGAASAQALKALLHLWNDSLDAAHDLVQDMETPTGSALHGIMHRREGDFANAKYWFRRAGDHPAWHGLQARASEWLQEEGAAGRQAPGSIGEALRTIAAQGIWNPYLFTDAVAMTVTEGRHDEAALSALEQLQWLEFSAFMRFLESRLR